MLDVGDTRRLRAEVRNDAGDLVTPATVLLRITRPDGTAVTPTVTLPPVDTGVLLHDYLIEAHGRHVVYWRTTNPNRAFADAFSAAPESWPGIVGLTEVKRHLNMPLDDTSQDEELRGFVLSASAVVEDVTGVMARRTITETNSGGGRHIVLSRAPVLDVAEVVADGVEVDPGDYTASPSGLLARRSGRWPAGLRNVEVTYVVGRESIPFNVLDATLELIRINWRPQQGGNYSAFDGGGGDDFGVSAGAEASLQGSLRLGFFVPNTVVQRLSPDQRGPVVL